MKIILQQDMQKLGRKFDIKNVRGGYARNFLFPKGFAKPATAPALAVLASQRMKEEKRQETEHTMYQKTAEALAGTTLHFKVKVGEKGRTFGSVTAVKILNELKKRDIAVEKDWIELEGPIKTAGEKAVEIKLPQGVKGTLKISVEAEE